MNKEAFGAFDLNVFSLILTKVTVERALNAELEDHLG